MDLFQVLGDKTRRDIIKLLAKNGKMSASQISGKFNVSAPAVSQHLKVLQDFGFVDVEKKAQKRIYHFNPDPMHELRSWTREMMGLWDGRFGKFEEVLKNE